MRSVTGTLIRIYARAWYRVHAGMLVFVFIMLVSYCFFINPLGHELAPKAALLWQLKLVLQSVTEPLVMALFFLAFLLYTVKSLKFQKGLMLLPELEFLYYSLVAGPFQLQLVSWVAVQLIISLPVLLLGGFGVIVGIGYHHLLMPLIMLAYILFLPLLGALYMQKLSIQPKSVPASASARLVRSVPKPIFSLLFYLILDRLKLNFIFTKALSAAGIALMISFLPDNQADVRLTGISMLLVATAHAVLIFQQQKFGRVYLSFTANLPYSSKRSYFGLAGSYLILLLPEFIWLLVRNGAETAIQMILIACGCCILFSSLTRLSGMDMSRYLKFIAVVILIGSGLILTSLSWLLILLLFTGSFIFYTLSYPYIQE